MAILSDYPGDTDTAKAHRSVAAYEWFLALTRSGYKRNDALLLLDPNKNGGVKKPTMFGVSERHIRRVETIRAKRPKQAARLEQIAKQGTVSLETIEHLTLHPSTDLVEVIWLVLDNDAGQLPRGAGSGVNLAPLR
jgi:hypothetical protein